MSRFWSILFFLVPILGVTALAVATLGIAPLESARLPSSFSESGNTIDRLLNGVRLLTAGILLGAGFAIGWVLWKFDFRHNPQEKARYIKHNTKLEMVWTIVPACILVCLAFLQLKFWSGNSMDRPTISINGETISKPPEVMVKAKQFGWEFHYAGADGVVETRDDIYIENLLVLPAGEEIVLQLESRDVIHSFCVPALRLKQDVVPGETQYVWFSSRAIGEIEIVCTEFCGWGHSTMKADLHLVDRPTYDLWLAEQTSTYLPELKIESAKVTYATGVISLAWDDIN